MISMEHIDGSNMKVLDKQSIRSSIRSLMQEGDFSDEDEEICRRIMALPLWEKAQRVFCYVPCPGEVDVHPLMTAALEQGKELYAPRIIGVGSMMAARLDSLDDLFPGPYNIPAPSVDTPLCSDPCLAIVPGVAFDPRSLARLGRGGGYYDRWLTGKKCMLIAPCRKVQLVEDLPMEPHDICVNMLVTAERIYEKA